MARTMIVLVDQLGSSDFKRGDEFKDSDESVKDFDLEFLYNNGAIGFKNPKEDDPTPLFPAMPQAQTSEVTDSSKELIASLKRQNADLQDKLDAIDDTELNELRKANAELEKANAELTAKLEAASSKK